MFSTWAAKPQEAQRKPNDAAAGLPAAAPHRFKNQCYPLGELEMDTAVKEKLNNLKVTVQSSLASDVPGYIKEEIVVVTTRLLDNNASNEEVASQLRGGLRAIGDVITPSNDDPIVKIMVELVNC